MSTQPENSKYSTTIYDAKDLCVDIWYQIIGGARVAYRIRTETRNGATANLTEALAKSKIKYVVKEQLYSRQEGNGIETGYKR
jgi:hypothetical protein